MEHVRKSDPQVAEAMAKELERQQNEIELIASENFVSRAVMEAMGTVLTNKYAEGYPGRRYYGGCEYVDIVENLARDRAKQLYGAEYANVQPHSGAQANMAVYAAFLDPGDKVLGMNLSHGGHLTHGSPVNFSGKMYEFIEYGVDKDTELIDYDEVERIALETKPKMLVAGASAYPRIIDFQRLGAIAKEAGAYFMVDMAHIAGLVATGHHPNPVPHADVVTTTTHKTLRGPRGGMILCKEAYAKKIDSAVFPRTQGGPLMHVIAAKAVSFSEALKDSFREYSAQIIRNAEALAEGLLGEGLRLVSGGTDNHLILIDVRSLGLTGKRAEELLGNVGITVNKNTIPFDPETPFVTSGLRIGTPAVTTRGFREADMAEIARIIAMTLKHPDDADTERDARARVAALCEAHPLYEELRYA